MGNDKSNKELKGLAAKTYNNSDFALEVILGESSSGIFQKYAKDEILRIQLDHDILSYYDKGSILLKDFSNFYTILANSDGNWSISLTIVQIESYELVPEAMLRKEYNITSVNIEEITPTYATVRINFADAIEQIFNRNAIFSSQNDADASSVLKGLLKSIGFRDDAEGIVELPKIDASGIQINYITDNNNNALRHIDFITSQIYNETKGFLFIYFHPNENKLKAFWSKDVLNANIPIDDNFEKYKNAAYYLKIASADDADRADYNIAEIKAYNNIIPYNNAARIIYPTYIQNFNVKTSRMEVPDSGVWKNEKFKELFSQNVLMNTSLPKSLEEPSSVFTTLSGFYNTVPDAAVGKFYRQSNIDEFRQRLRSYFIYKNMMSFKVLGKIWREPGHVFEIMYSQGPNVDKLAGKWLCTKIVDDFESQEYYQYIFLTRISDTVDYDAIVDYTNAMKIEADKRKATGG